MAMKPITVSQLNGYMKRVLQADPLLGNISVIGEISNLKFHGTGHVYFTLKDQNSKINCFLAADNLKQIHYELSDGMEITASGYIYLYERGGTYSINIRDIEVQGTGNLAIAYEKLKEKLSKEGLFDETYKKQIPFFPLKIGVITSETGAAVKDIVTIVKNRNHLVDVLIYPVLVQGPGAAADISGAIDKVNEEFPEIDTIIVGRGGGSMEELWAFNEEIVARSIFKSKIPIISAVGHEIDFTIADFVADRRAETPTAAAQIAVPHIGELHQSIDGLKENLLHNMNKYIQYKEMAVQSCSAQAMYTALENKIALNQLRLEGFYKENLSNIQRKLTACQTAAAGVAENLEALNPLSILKRGYGAVLDEEGRLASSIARFKREDGLTVVFSDGKVDCRVTDVRRSENGRQEIESIL